MHPWLSRLRHDLVKRAVWAARDVREAGSAPSAADVLELRRGLFDLRDAEGQPVIARQLWDRLCAEAPHVPAAALGAFGGALAEAEQRVTGLAERPETWREALEAILGIETAFAALARTLEEE